MGSRRTLAAFTAASAFFGGTFVAAKYGLQYFPPLLFVSLRFDIAAVALIGYVVFTRSRDELVPRTRSDVVDILAAGGLSIGLTSALLFSGQQYASSAVGAIVFSLNPVLTPVFAAFALSDERLSRRAAIGMAVGLVGVVLVVDPAPASILAGGLGKVLLLGAAVSAALGSVFVRRADGSLSSLVRTAWALPVGALLCHALSVASGESLAAVAWTPTGALALAYLGVFAGAAAYIAYFGLLDETGPIRANLVFYLTPVVATVGGWAILGEAVSALTVAGFLVVFAGFAIVASESVDRRAVLPVALVDRDGPPNRVAIDDQPNGFEAD